VTGSPLFHRDFTWRGETTTYLSSIAIQLINFLTPPYYCRHHLFSHWSLYSPSCLLLTLSHSFSTLLQTYTFVLGNPADSPLPICCLRPLDTFRQISIASLSSQDPESCKKKTTYQRPSTAGSSGCQPIKGQSQTLIVTWLYTSLQRVTSMVST